MKHLLPFLFLFCLPVLAQIPSYVPVSGLQCYYPFNGNGNDASVLNNHLTNNGAVLTTDRFGTTDAAYNFNGSTQFLIRNTPSFTFNPTSTFTVSLWHNRNTSSVVGIPIMHATNTAGNFIWIFQTGATSMQFGTNKQQSSWIWAQSTSTTNVWTHIVLVYNAGAMTLYKDNVAVATGTFNHTGVTSATLPLYIGRGIGGSYFNGKIDDIGIWNRCLSACEINDLFTATNTLTTVSAGPDLYACNGGAVTLTGTGAQTYSWTPNVANGSTFTPSINQAYTLTGFDANGCSAWDQTNILLENFSINAGQNLTVCQGDSAVLTATGSPNIIWNNNDVSNGIPFYPLNSGYITAFATSTNGCLASDSVLLTVNPAPSIDAGQDFYTCPGDSITLLASGGNNLIWNGTIANDTTFVPIASATYVVSGESSLGCFNSDTLQVFYGTFPDLNAGQDQSVCFGDEVILYGTGGIFMSWNNNIADSIPFVPQQSGSYVLTGASNEGCVGTDTVYVSVNDASSNTITASAIDSYTLNGQTYTASGTYSQVLTNAAGCDSLLTLNLTLDFTGLQEIVDASLLVYPNPAQDLIFLAVDPDLIGSNVMICDALGRIILETTLHKEETGIDLREFTSGTYSIKVGSHTQRLEILR
jgi:Concanavalin A-like lectin/glucanases superfamily/Secretion system C-terminal sorting domain